MLVLVYYLLTGNMFILAFPVWSLYGYAMLILGTCILFTQGVLVNVKNKFLEEKNQMYVEEDFHMCLDDEEDSGVEKGVLECKK
jgi:cellulose synthase/poly-beta-1,6-N-acetylglucosamine synthase-like glycosyltransferase